jgi:hypothetical protein
MLLVYCLQGFSRGSSTYRGVTAHPSGRWESRIGVPGSKHVYLGLFNEEIAAAQVRLPTAANIKVFDTLRHFKSWNCTLHGVTTMPHMPDAAMMVPHNGIIP